jgi:hypothetical protein
MALSVMINLDDLLFAAYNIGVASNGTEPSLTKAELRAKLLANVPLVGCTEPKIKTASEEKPSPKPKAEKKPRETKPKAEKPVVELCSARAFYEKEHVEDGKLKKMTEDDEANEFGGRCKFKQSGESTFCKHHAEKQPHGVWGGEYAGKLKSLIEKAKAPVAEPSAAEDKPKAAEDKPKTKAVKKIVKKAAAPAEDNEAPKTPTKPKNKTKTVKPNAPKRPAEEDEESDVDEDAEDEYLDGKVLETAGIEYEWIEIDDISYTIDANGNVYDPETEEKVGQYNTKAKKWISGGPATE